MKKIIFAIAILSVVATSCKKDPVETTPTPSVPAATTGSLKLEFENMVDTNALTFNTVKYINANNDTFTVSKFKYYISNIKLTKSDGSSIQTNGYYLIDEEVASSKMITITEVPFGTYNSISFLIGVDSARNVSGSQTGALDPTNGMFWSWSSGYIMAKLEGSSNQSGASTKALTFHIGGFSGANSVLKTVSPSLNGNTANVSSTITPEVHYKCDLSKFFKGVTTTNFATTHTVHMPGTAAKNIADNYANMFSFDHIHN